MGSLICGRWGMSEGISVIIKRLYGHSVAGGMPKRKLLRETCNDLLQGRVVFP